ncbi:hypothetical protein [Azotosporobacter soli]|uniref:hypothetical protein n=1 Tax=Azotosporobacter soli TaxID=3055040 RepID=UPI0031FECEC6
MRRHANRIAFYIDNKELFFSAFKEKSSSQCKKLWLTNVKSLPQQAFSCETNLVASRQKHRLASANDAACYFSISRSTISCNNSFVRFTGTKLLKLILSFSTTLRQGEQLTQKRHFAP